MNVLSIRQTLRSALYFLALSLITLSLIQCSDSSGPTAVNDIDPDGPLAPNPNCTDTLAVKTYLALKFMSVSAAPTQDTENNDIIICPGDDDIDGDTISDDDDNCPNDWNFTQTDTDGDNIGDSCDNCADLGNENQSDKDGDDIGDSCDADRDADGFDDSADNCDEIYNPSQTDTDGDGFGDVCDAAPEDPSITDNDYDGDGILDDDDNCPTIDNAFLPASGTYDYTTDYQWDTDGDGEGNVCDDDIDGDGRLNDIDDCDFNPRSDCLGTDTDGDEIPDDYDNCDNNVNPGQEDSDGNDIGDACDTDEPEEPTEDPSEDPAEDPTDDPAEPVKDADGDGLCDNSELCDAIDPDGTKANYWFYMGPTGEMNPPINIAGTEYTHLFTSDLGTGIVDDTGVKIYHHCESTSGEFKVSVVAPGICIKTKSGTLRPFDPSILGPGRLGL